MTKEINTMEIKFEKEIQENFLKKLGNFIKIQSQQSNAVKELYIAVIDALQQPYQILLDRCDQKNSEIMKLQKKLSASEIKTKAEQNANNKFLNDFFKKEEGKEQDKSLKSKEKDLDGLEQSQSLYKLAEIAVSLGVNALNEKDFDAKLEKELRCTVKDFAKGVKAVLFGSKLSELAGAEGEKKKIFSEITSCKDKAALTSLQKPTFSEELTKLETAINKTKTEINKIRSEAISAAWKGIPDNEYNLEYSYQKDLIARSLFDGISRNVNGKTFIYNLTAILKALITGNHEINDLLNHVITFALKANSDTQTQPSVKNFLLFFPICLAMAKTDKEPKDVGQQADLFGGVLDMLDMLTAPDLFSLFKKTMKETSLDDAVDLILKLAGIKANILMKKLDMYFDAVKSIFPRLLKLEKGNFQTFSTISQKFDNKALEALLVALSKLSDMDFNTSLSFLINLEKQYMPKLIMILSECNAKTIQALLPMLASLDDKHSKALLPKLAELDGKQLKVLLPMLAELDDKHSKALLPKLAELDGKQLKVLLPRLAELDDEHFKKLAGLLEENKKGSSTVKLCYQVFYEYLLSLDDDKTFDEKLKILLPDLHKSAKKIKETGGLEDLERMRIRKDLVKMSISYTHGDSKCAEQYKEDVEVGYKSVKNLSRYWEVSSNFSLKANSNQSESENKSNKKKKAVKAYCSSTSDALKKLCKYPSSSDLKKANSQYREDVTSALNATKEPLREHRSPKKYAWKFLLKTLFSFKLNLLFCLISALCAQREAKKPIINEFIQYNMIPTNSMRILSKANKRFVTCKS